MADIFISYSKQDRDLARLLATFLQAEGYSVWWDTGLLSGQNFRKVIMTELGRARVAIVIWTPHSIGSDWVQSEAGRGHADRKLIPVKVSGLSYKEIPPPFDNMHIEDFDDREKIIAAVVAQLAKPELQASAYGRIANRARFEFLSWAGILGAVITLTTNIQSVLRLAKWAQIIVASWTSLLSNFWASVLFFLPAVSAADAVFLTLLSFAALNIVVCFRREPQAPVRARVVSSIVIATAILIAIFLFGFFQALERHSLFSGVAVFGYFGIWMSYIGIDVLQLFPNVRVMIASLTLVMMLLTLVPVILLFLAIGRATPFRLDPSALASRLWRIVIGIGVVIVLNSVSVWLEQQPWLAQGAG